MEDDEELKNQCWGGEYLSEVRFKYITCHTITQGFVFANLCPRKVFFLRYYFH